MPSVSNKIFLFFPRQVWKKENKKEWKKEQSSVKNKKNKNQRQGKKKRKKRKEKKKTDSQPTVMLSAVRIFRIRVPALRSLLFLNNVINFPAVKQSCLHPSLPGSGRGGGGASQPFLHNVTFPSLQFMKHRLPCSRQPSKTMLLLRINPSFTALHALICIYDACTWWASPSHGIVGDSHQSDWPTLVMGCNKTRILKYKDRAVP